MEMKNKIITYLIRECSLDSRIKSGLFNPFQQEHIEVLKEKLFEMNFDQEIIREFTNKIAEGKYPERQAYNKEGFLVTFPTPDYKANAISTGNYFNYDPTHGKGGMHLIKKADPEDIKSTVDIQDTQVTQKSPENVPSSSIQEPLKPSPQEPSVQSDSPKTTHSPENTPEKNQNPVSYTTTQNKPELKKIETPVQQPVDFKEPETPKSVSKAPTPPETKTLSKKEKEPMNYLTGEPEGTPLELTDFSAYKDPSLEWAHNQKWEKRDNGNYYDDKGNLRAVIGLDGAAVPATENDRVSLRQWIEKKRKERLPGEKY